MTLTLLLPPVPQGTLSPKWRALIETSNRADFPKVPHCQRNDTESFSELITLARLKGQEAQILSLSVHTALKLQTHDIMLNK